MNDQIDIDFVINSLGDWGRFADYRRIAVAYLDSGMSWDQFCNSFHNIPVDRREVLEAIESAGSDDTAVAAIHAELQGGWYTFNEADWDALLTELAQQYLDDSPNTTPGATSCAQEHSARDAAYVFAHPQLPALPLQTVDLVDGAAPFSAELTEREIARMELALEAALAAGVGSVRRGRRTGRIMFACGFPRYLPNGDWWPSETPYLSRDLTIARAQMKHAGIAY
jgi:hypothetical protein